MSSTTKQDITINARHSRLATKDDAKNNLSMHLLPCRVDCDVTGSENGFGSAKVSSFFDPVIRDTNETVSMSGGERVRLYGATFRGRMLRGVELKVPEGYEGVVLREEKGSSHAVEGREFEVKGRFDKFHYWNLEAPPTGDSKLVQAMTWTQLARKLHCPLPLKSDDAVNHSEGTAMDVST